MLVGRRVHLSLRAAGGASVQSICMGTEQGEGARKPRPTPGPEVPTCLPPGLEVRLPFLGAQCPHDLPQILPVTHVQQGHSPVSPGSTTSRARTLGAQPSLTLRWELAGQRCAKLRGTIPEPVGRCWQAGCKAKGPSAYHLGVGPRWEGRRPESWEPPDPSGCSPGGRQAAAGGRCQAAGPVFLQVTWGMGRLSWSC